ncbi:MAG TPA: tetratricopeptide repeat protein [Candidatus Udaeobacter sp.]|nr:tetratricopeptide repeat protein [Candidatus Udaeobacter sp.]
MSIRKIALFIAVIASLAAVHANVPIIVSAGVGRRVAMSLSNKAEKQLENGDVAGAKRNVEAALKADPKFWPALYQRAEIFAMQGKHELAIQDCNEALRQYPAFVDASLLRASINAMFGKYAEALKEFNYVISLHPQRVTLGRALKQRAWLQATCPNAAFRNGQQAIKDAKAACSIAEWRDENTIDTLAAAYAETGDFDSAARYAAQALAVKGITPIDSKRIQKHLTLFQQHQPIRL